MPLLSAAEPIRVAVEDWNAPAAMPAPAFLLQPSGSNAALVRPTSESQAQAQLQRRGAGTAARPRCTVEWEKSTTREKRMLKQSEDGEPLPRLIPRSGLGQAVLLPSAPICFQVDIG